MVFLYQFEKIPEKSKLFITAASCNQNSEGLNYILIIKFSVRDFFNSVTFVSESKHGTGN